MRRSDEMTSSTTPTSSAVSGSQVTPARRSTGIIIVVLMAACLLFVASYVQKLGEKAAVEAQIVAMQQQIEQAKVRTAILSKELAQANDDAHVAAIARDSLDLVQEGDQLIAIVDPGCAEAPCRGGSGSDRADAHRRQPQLAALVRPPLPSVLVLTKKC